MLTPAMRANTTWLPGAPSGTGSAMRAASALTRDACREKESTRSPARHIRTADPTSRTRPRWP